MKKVIVIGSPGSGKSTFSRRLRDITGLPLYYLDMIYHKPDKTTVSREDLPWIETELDGEFREFVESFSAQILPKIYGLIEKYGNEKEIIVFKSRRESELYLENSEKGTCSLASILP